MLNGWEEPQPSISWKKIREKSGGHLYHHIHELDCVQFIMGGLPTTVTMSASDVAHNGEQFGDEDDLIMLNLVSRKQICSFRVGFSFSLGRTLRAY